MMGDNLEQEASISELSRSEESSLLELGSEEESSDADSSGILRFVF